MYTLVISEEHSLVLVRRCLYLVEKVTNPPEIQTTMINLKYTEDKSLGEVSHVLRGLEVETGITTALFKYSKPKNIQKQCVAVKNSFDIKLIRLELMGTLYLHPQCGHGL